MTEYRINYFKKKLLDLGIRGNAYAWLRSYLQDRKQYVQINHFNNDTSEHITIDSKIITTNCSIPQGSVLGCILSLAYINDLPKITKPKCIMLADDVSLLFKCPKDFNINPYIQDTFESIKKWLYEHNLEINTNKTKLIHCKPYQNQQLDLSETKKNIRYR